MAPPSVTSPTVAVAYLQSHQRLEAEDKLLYALIDWLLPHLRLKSAQTSARWDDFWRLFKADGTMGWDDFEKFLRWDCKLNARKLFDLLDESSTGRITSRNVLDIRRRYERVIDCRHQGLEDLKVILLRNYGNLMRAWRVLLDPECRGRCSHTWFVKCCKEVGFHGDLKTAWSELTGGDVHRPAVPKDLDPDADQMMKDFSNALRRYHGSPRDGWYAIMRAHGNFGRMAPENFDRVCLDMHFNTKFAKKLFGYLDLNCDKNVSLDEWEFLALWDRIPGAGDDADGLGQNGNDSMGAGPFEGGPRKASAWQTALNGGASADVSPSGGNAGGGGNDGVTVEFHVILTKEEHKEYLRRRRELDMHNSGNLSATARMKSAAQTRPADAWSASRTRGTPDPWGHQ